MDDIETFFTGYPARVCELATVRIERSYDLDGALSELLAAAAERAR